MKGKVGRDVTTLVRGMLRDDRDLFPRLSRRRKVVWDRNIILWSRLTKC